MLPSCLMTQQWLFVQTGKSYVLGWTTRLFPPAYFCVTYLSLAPGNLNLLPVEAQQLTRIVSVGVELTLAPSSPCLSKDIKMGWHHATVHPGDHVCVWVQFLIEYTLHERAGGQWSSHENEVSLINIDAVSVLLGNSSAENSGRKWPHLQSPMTSWSLIMSAWMGLGIFNEKYCGCFYIFNASQSPLCTQKIGFWFNTQNYWF